MVDVVFRVSQTPKKSFPGGRSAVFVQIHSPSRFQMAQPKLYNSRVGTTLSFKVC